VSSPTNSQNVHRGGSLWSVLWAGVALFCFAAAVYFSGRERQYVNETIRLRRQLESADAQLAEWRESAAILASDPSTLSLHSNGISLGMLRSPGRGVLLFASHLPSAPKGKGYEVWYERAGQNPAPAGVLRPNRDGSAIHVDRNASVAGAETLLITQEDETGAAQPTSPPIFQAAIPQAAPR